MRTWTNRTRALIMIGVIVSSVVGLAPQASATAAFTDNGTGITCSVSGSVTFDPPLNDVSTGSSAVNVHDRLAQCTGAVTQFHVTLTGGWLKSMGDPLTSPTSCSSYMAAKFSVAALMTEIRYTSGKPGDAPPKTGTTWPGGNASWSEETTGMVLPQVLTLTYDDPAAVQGSFSSGTGPPASMTMVLDQDSSVIGQECSQGPGHGVKKVTFTGVHGPSSVTIG